MPYTRRDINPALGVLLELETCRVRAPHEVLFFQSCRSNLENFEKFGTKGFNEVFPVLAGQGEKFEMPHAPRIQ